ncbi:hypothetical protein EOM71_02070, partial [Candidatus Falkowbacteria bacterium]|nr:hypothetical protein [Candidatus Falkowbacteria bacterium]
MNSPFRLSLASLIILALAGLTLPAAAQLTSNNKKIEGLVNDGTIDKITTTVTTTIASTSVSPDAIAIRIFDNSNNLSPRAWYNQNIGARRSL